LRNLKYFNGFRPECKEFRSGVRDFSGLKSGFMDFGPDFGGFRCGLKGFRLHSWNFTSYPRDFSWISRFTSRISEPFGRISRIKGNSEVLHWISECEFSSGIPGHL